MNDTALGMFPTSMADIISNVRAGRKDFALDLYRVRRAQSEQEPDMPPIMSFLSKTHYVPTSLAQERLDEKDHTLLQNAALEMLGKRLLSFITQQTDLHAAGGTQGIRTYLMENIIAPAVYFNISEDKLTQEASRQSGMGFIEIQQKFKNKALNLKKEELRERLSSRLTPVVDVSNSFSSLMQEYGNARRVYEDDIGESFALYEDIMREHQTVNKYIVDRLKHSMSPKRAVIPKALTEDMYQLLILGKATESINLQDFTDTTRKIAENPKLAAPLLKLVVQRSMHADKDIQKSAVTVFDSLYPEKSDKYEPQDVAEEAAQKLREINTARNRAAR